MIQKGKVSSVVDGGKKITATPFAGGIVTSPLVVPAALIGVLPVGTAIVYTVFEDGTGIVISRVDGTWNENAISPQIVAYSDGDTIVIGGAV